MPIVIADIALQASDQATAAQIRLLKDAGVLTAVDAAWTLGAIPDARQALAETPRGAWRVDLDGGRAVRLCKGLVPREVGRGAVEKGEYASAADEFDARVTEHMQRYQSLKDQAINAVATAHPGLWAAYAQDQRYGRNGAGRVAKSHEPRAYEQIVAEARQVVAKSTDTTMVQALAQLVEDHHGRADYLDAYRRYLRTQGYVDHDRAPVVKSQPARSMYDVMHHRS